MAKNNLGFSLIEVLGALAIGGLMTIGLSAIINASMEDTKGQQAAYYQAQVTAAAAKYISTNYGTLSITATDTVPVVIALNTLQTAGLLSGNIGDANPYGQTPCVLVLRTVKINADNSTTALLNALVVTEGGIAIDDVNIGSVAAKSGQGGGYISTLAPGIARGAYNSWSISTTTTPALANFLSQNCSGTSATGGHLVNALFYDGPDQVTSDYLYRNQVDGQPELNQIKTPLHIVTGSNAQAIEGSSDARCNATTGKGKIAVDSEGKLLNCYGGTWKSAGASTWRDPVSDLNSLPTEGNTPGDVRLVQSTNRAYTWTINSNGQGSWVLLGIDNDGNFVVPATVVSKFIQTTETVVKNTSCSSYPSGLMAKDNSGQLLTCQNGQWQAQGTMELASTWSGCLRIKPSKYGELDWWPPCLDIFPQSDISYTSDVDTYGAPLEIKIPPPARNGIVSINVSSNINRTSVNDPSVKGQWQIEASLLDNDTGQLLGVSRSMTPGLHNESSSLSIALIKGITPNTNGYTLWILNAWSFFNGPQVWDEANYMTYQGTIIQQTPLLTHWSVDLFY